jgi:23S rRNA (uridine2552-2'-O)-methyltransferase
MLVRGSRAALLVRRSIPGTAGSLPLARPGCSSVAKGDSSARWKQRQSRDPYVRRAQAEGWRSRAVYKLEEIQQKDRILGRGQTVVDLGAAPGAWCQFATRIVGAGGRVIALDLLEMDPLPGVEFIQGDFQDESTFDQLLALTGPDKVDVVLSDMAPNMTGVRAVDQPRSIYLAELTLDFAGRVLRPGGSLVAKLFQGEGFTGFVTLARARFEDVRLRKPAASRPENREIYLVARNFRL